MTCPAYPERDGDHLIGRCFDVERQQSYTGCLCGYGAPWEPVEPLATVIDLLEFMLTGGPVEDPMRYPKLVAAFRDAFPNEYRQLMERVLGKEAT